MIKKKVRKRLKKICANDIQKCAKSNAPTCVYGIAN